MFVDASRKRREKFCGKHSSSFILFFLGKTSAGYQNNYFKVNKTPARASPRQKSFLLEIAGKYWLIFLF
jgi:hypothetical protein